MGNEVNKGATEAVSFDDMVGAEGGLPESNGSHVEEGNNAESEPSSTTKTKAKPGQSAERGTEAAEETETSTEVDEAAKALADKRSKEKKKDGEGEEEADDKTVSKKPIEGQKKAYKVKNGEQEVELRPDAKVMVPVGGKMKEVTVADLASEYSGKVNWSQKMEEVSRERKTVETEKSNINNSIKQVYDYCTEKKDPRGLVYFVAESVGADPVQTWQTMVKQVASSLKAAGFDLDEKAVEAGFKDDELEYHRGKNARDAESRKKEQTMGEIDRRTKAAQERFGKDEEGNLVFDNRRLVETYDAMIKTGKYKPEDITPESCADFFSESFSVEIAEKVLASDEYDVENRDQAIRLLSETKLKFPEFTLEDLKEVAKEVFGSNKRASKALSKKVQKAERGTVNRKPSQSVEAVSFDDI